MTAIDRFNAGEPVPVLEMPIENRPLILRQFKALGWTLTDIGNVCGISRERVRQLTEDVDMPLESRTRITHKKCVDVLDLLAERGPMSNPEILAALGLKYNHQQQRMAINWMEKTGHIELCGYRTEGTRGLPAKVFRLGTGNPPVVEHPSERYDRLVLEMVRSQGPVTRAEVADAVGLGVMAIIQRLEALVDAGVAARTTKIVRGMDVIAYQMAVQRLPGRKYLTAHDYLLALGDEERTPHDIAAMFDVKVSAVNAMLYKLEREGLVERRGTAKRRPGSRGRPPRLWRRTT